MNQEEKLENFKLGNKYNLQVTNLTLNIKLAAN